MHTLTYTYTQYLFFLMACSVQSFSSALASLSCSLHSDWSLMKGQQFGEIRNFCTINKMQTCLPPLRRWCSFCFFLEVVYFILMCLLPRMDDKCLPRIAPRASPYLHGCLHTKSKRLKLLILYGRLSIIMCNVDLPEDAILPW